MKTGFAVLVGVGALSLAMGVGDANAAVKYYSSRHKSHAVQAPTPRADVGDLIQTGNNPAKKYPTRALADNAVKTATLPQAGNNVAKRYATREIAANAAQSGTLPQHGNNPAKRYAVAASR